MILSSSSTNDLKQQNDVTVDDQQMINRFARLNLKSDELQTKYNEYKRQIENLEEAENELMLQDDDFNDDDDDDELNDDNDDDKTKKLNGKQVMNNILRPASSNIQFVIGTSFIALTKNDCEKFIEQNKNQIKDKMKNIDNELQPMKDEMNSIKSKLYAKFGKNINLDSEDS